MQTVLLFVHLFACIALVIAVMLQRSEGGALGMSGGGTGGIISGRGAANVLVRTTMVLAAVFFVTSITMTRLNAEDVRRPTDLERQIEQQTTDPLAGGATPDHLGAAPRDSTTTTTPATTTAPTIDPLAPVTTPAPATTTPAPAPSTTTATPPAATTPAPAKPAPTTTPAQPAPTPNNP